MMNETGKNEHRLVALLGRAGSGKDTVGHILVEEHGYYSMALADPLKMYLRRMLDWDENVLWGPSEKREERDTRYEILQCPECGAQLNEKNVHGVTVGSTYYCSRCEKHAPREEWRTHLSPRLALQGLGDLVRSWDKDSPVEVLLRRVRTALEMNSPYYDHVGQELLLGVKNTRWGGGVMTLNKTPSLRVCVTDCRFVNEMQKIVEAGGTILRIVRKAEEDEKAVWTGMHDHASEDEQLEESIEDLVDVTIHNNGSREDLREKVLAYVEGKSNVNG